MKRKILWLLVLIGVILGMYFFYPFILEGMARFLIVQDKLCPADAIVILGGDFDGERVREGVNLYKQGYAHKILMCGGPLTWRLTYAVEMRDYARELGVPSRDILMEDESRSTLENAKFALPIIKKQKYNSFILVTSPTHSRRTRRVFNKVFSKEKIKVIVCPVKKSQFQVSRWWERHEDVQQVVWEYVSLVFYLIKGY